jgi:hypothetical protein
MKRLITIITCSIIIVSYAAAQTIDGTFAIQNTETGKNLRPYEAGNKDGNRIVLYNHVEWKCMTWRFTKTGDNTYQLKNLFTSKTFEPEENPAKSGTPIIQQSISAKGSQQWEFIKASDKSYFIRLKGTELYITASSSETNSAIILKEKQNKSLQEWRLVAQNPNM